MAITMSKLSLPFFVSDLFSLVFLVLVYPLSRVSQTLPKLLTLHHLYIIIIYLCI